MSGMPKAVWSGSFTVWGVEMKCHLLDNGVRVIEADSMNRFMSAMEGGINPEQGDLMDFLRWQQGK